jgi:hypothetical protein
VAKLNPADAKLQPMIDITAQGYKRKQAPELLTLSEATHPAHDVTIGGISLWESIRQTLRVEALRSDPDTRLDASAARELVMKELVLSHYRQEPEGKVFLRFGRNHLHRGYDARGVSARGNFVAEWALAENKSVFNVGAFAAGGREHLGGETFDADEHQDELSFAMISQIAGSNATTLNDGRSRPKQPRPAHESRCLQPLLHHSRTKIEE